MINSLPERIARTEQSQKHHDERMDDISDQLRELDDKVGNIISLMESQRGFYKGVLFTLTAIGGALGAIFTQIYHNMFTK